MNNHFDQTILKLNRKIAQKLGVGNGEEFCIKEIRKNTQKVFN